MSATTILILPGLDGTNLMLNRFAEICGRQHPVVVGTLPADATLSYYELAEHFDAMVNEFSSCHIIAESFSGPIGILLATKHPEVVTRLTLVASFATTPVPRLAAHLPWFLFFRFPIPKIWLPNTSLLENRNDLFQLFELRFAATRTQSFATVYGSFSTLTC